MMGTYIVFAGGDYNEYSTEEDVRQHVEELRAEGITDIVVYTRDDDLLD